ncbi:MAG: hypothetical protein KBT39_01895 [Bacteroidales bacterium]|nr:hypothetical protein [Bacteroidales bacterium]
MTTFNNQNRTTHTHNIVKNTKRILAVLICLLCLNATASANNDMNSELLANHTTTTLMETRKVMTSERALMTRLLKYFCENFYSQHFAKKYIYGSLEINNIVYDNGVYHILGIHDYSAKLPHRGVSFKAEVQNVNGNLLMEFHKWSEPDLLHPKGKWEDCSFVVNVNVLP